MTGVRTSGPGTLQRAVATRWYCASRFSQRRTLRGEELWWPSAVTHAKTTGSTTTACGAPADNMRKFFYAPFPSPDAENCEACLAALDR